MMNVYRKLKRACMIFGICIILFNCTNWGIEPIALLLVEILFLIYLVRWLERGRPQNTKRLLFFCTFLIGTGFGRLIGDIVFKLIITGITIVSAMVYLYSIRIQVSLDRKSLLEFFSAMVYWPFAYVYDFLQGEKYTPREQRQHQRVINGLFLAGIVALIILVPLYMTGDPVFAGWVVLLVGWISDNIFCFALAIAFGWVPAMLIFSYVKGIREYTGTQSVPETVLAGLDTQHMFFNRFSITAVFVSCSIVNLIFSATQLAYLLDTNLENDNITNPGSIFAIFTAIGINVIVVVFLAIMINVRKIHMAPVPITSANMIYAVSVILASVGFAWRYVAAVITYGLKGIWPIWGVGLLILLSIMACNVVHILYNYDRFVKILCYSAAILFLIFNISVPEYWIGKINVKIFDYKYNSGLLKNVSSEVAKSNMSKVVIDAQDLDLEYLESLQLWAVPSLVDITEVENLYGETGKKVGEIAEEAIVDIFAVDLPEDDQITIKTMSEGEKIPYLIAQLEEELDYKLPGKKMVILQMLKQTYE